MGVYILPAKKRDMGSEKEKIDFIEDLKRLANMRQPNDSMRFYRRMELQFVEKTIKEQGLVANGPTGEGWMSTSLKHSRVFENQSRSEHDGERVVVFRVDIKRFVTEFRPEDIIVQAGSATVNKYRVAKGLTLANLVNYERLHGRDFQHPWQKFNICMKGETNVRKFNKCIEEIRVLSIRTAEDGMKEIYDPNPDYPDEDGVEHSSESEERNSFAM